MAPILSKPQPPPPKTAQEAVELLGKRAKPLLDALLDLVHGTLVKGGQAAGEASAAVSHLGRLADQFVQRSVRLLESYCCLDLKRYARGPEPKLQGSLPILFVLMLLMMLYNAFVFAYMPAAGIAVTSPTSIIFHAFVFLVLASFVQAVRTDPGGVPSGRRWRTQGQPPPEVRQRKRGSDEARWCRKTEAYKPDRAHYCRVLERVVLRMDHHCPWLGNTVGYGNHKFFILFLFYASSACAILGVSIVQLLVHATLPALTTFLLIGAEGLTLLLSSILVPFFLFHFWLLARNMTTIEFCEMMRERDGERGKDEEASGSAYDIGFFANISSVMGANPLTWWAPVGGPMGDGVRFPTQQDKAAAAAAACPAPAERKGEARRVAEASLPDKEAKESDPEAVHPSVTVAEEDEGDTNQQEAETGSAAEGSSDHSGSRDLESGSVVSAGESAARDFLVWHSATEFTDDLRIGCEFLGEALGNTALRVARLCAERGRTPRPRPSVALNGPSGAKRRRPTAVRFVPLPDNVGAGSDSGRSRGSGHSRGSGWDFLSD